MGVANPQIFFLFFYFFIYEFWPMGVAEPPS